MVITKNLTHNFGLSSGYAEIDSSNINFAVRRNILRQICPIDVTVKKFEIDSIVCPDFLSVDRANLLKLKFVGGTWLEGMNLENFHLKSYTNPYQVLLNHDAILDCSDLEKDKAEIQFTVKYLRDKELLTKE